MASFYQGGMGGAFKMEGVIKIKDGRKGSTAC